MFFKYNIYIYIFENIYIDYIYNIDANTKNSDGDINCNSFYGNNGEGGRRGKGYKFIYMN